MKTMKQGRKRNNLLLIPRFFVREVQLGAYTIVLFLGRYDT